MKKLLLLVFVALLFTGCADVTPIENCVTNNPGGFFSGLWHGFIILWAFFGSLLFDSMAIYEVNNTGGWYDFGFLLGSGIFGSGVTLLKKKR
jgi:hypothetical protein